MAKTMPAPKRQAAGAPAAAAQSEAQNKFDKFSAFALALPCAVLALIALVLAINYTNNQFGVNLFGIFGKTIQAWDGGADSIRSTSPVTIVGFESHSYVGRLNAGEVDVAVISVGRDQGVNLGDVFVLEGEQPNVRVEFVVFEVQAGSCRAYILLGQNVEGNAGREYSLRRDDIIKLCGGESGIKVKRPWKDQGVRRYVESRKN